MGHNAKTQPQTHTESSVASNGQQTVIIPSKPLPWYQKIVHALQLKKDVWTYVGIVVFLVIGFAITRATLHPQGLPTRAGTDTVKISIKPASTVMPPNTTFQLWETADNPVAFTTVKIVFDPKLVKMIGEISTSPSPLTRVVKQTAMSEANTTGIINLSLALDPTNRATPPTGTFKLATIPMAVNTTTQNLSATLHLDAAAMQVVNPDLNIFTITTVDSTLTLNPVPTATPTPTPTVRPLPTTTPPTNDTVNPTVTITTPANGSTIPAKRDLTVNVMASDASGIAAIRIAIDGKTNKTCSGATSCQFNIAVNRLTGGSHTITATATDRSTNKNTASTTIQVTK
jgi:hypothetical protein